MEQPTYDILFDYLDEEGDEKRRSYMRLKAVPRTGEFVKVNSKRYQIEAIVYVDPGNDVPDQIRAELKTVAPPEAPQFFAVTV